MAAILHMSAHQLERSTRLTLGLIQEFTTEEPGRVDRIQTLILFSSSTGSGTRLNLNDTLQLVQLEMEKMELGHLINHIII